MSTRTEDSRGTGDGLVVRLVHRTRSLPRGPAARPMPAYRPPRRLPCCAECSRRPSHSSPLAHLLQVEPLGGDRHLRTAFFENAVELPDETVSHFLVDLLIELDLNVIFVAQRFLKECRINQLVRIP